MEAFWVIFCDLFASSWRTFGQFLEIFKAIVGVLFASFWRAFWPVNGKLLGRFWRTIGLFLENFWAVVGELGQFYGNFCFWINFLLILGGSLRQFRREF